MPVWFLLLMLALGGWLGFESWRGLARGEISNFRNARGRIRKSEHPTVFWIVWTIATAAFLYVSAFTIVLALVRGVRI